MKKLSKPVRLLCIGLILILIGSVAANALQSNFWSVRVKDFTIGTTNQYTIHTLAFIPKECSAENKCPVVITSHGWLNSGEVQDAASIELSRRGVVVLAMDAYTHGMSSNVIGESRTQSSTRDGMGMVPLVEYVTSPVFNYIDTSRVGVMGHSMGGANSWATLIYYGKQYYAALEAAKKPDSDGGAEITSAELAHAESLSKVAAGLPTGSSPSLTKTNDRWKDIYANVGVLYGRYEEGGYRTSTGTADILGTAQESLEMMNYRLKAGEAQVTSVEEGKFYGSKEDKTLRVLYQPIVTHPLIHFDPFSTQDVIEYWTEVFDLKTNLGSMNQFFLVKELMNFVAMIGLFMLLIPMAQILMETPAFASLKGKEPPMLPALTPASSKRFWFGIILTGAVSFVTAVLTPKVYRAIFLTTLAGKPNTFFAASTLNCLMVWTAFNALWGFIWFWYNFKKDKAAGVRTDEMIGWKITKKEFWKTLALATAVIAGMYIVVWFCKWLFNTDFRIWTPAIKTFNPDKLIQFFQYLPVFFLFYLINSLFVNGALRVKGMSERANLFLCGFANIIGATILWAVQYGSLIFTHNVMWGPEWIDILVIAFAIPYLFVAPFLLRGFFKATGKVWLGAWVLGSLAVFINIMHTCITGPFF